MYLDTWVSLGNPLPEFPESLSLRGFFKDVSPGSKFHTQTVAPYLKFGPLL